MNIHSIFLYILCGSVVNPVAFVFAFPAAPSSATTAAVPHMARGQYTGADGGTGAISALPAGHPAAQSSHRSTILPQFRRSIQRNGYARTTLRPIYKQIPLLTIYRAFCPLPSKSPLSSNPEAMTIITLIR